MPGRPKNSRKSKVSKIERYKEHIKIRNDQEFNESKPKEEKAKSDESE